MKEVQFSTPQVPHSNRQEEKVEKKSIDNFENNKKQSENNRMIQSTSTENIVLLNRSVSLRLSNGEIPSNEKNNNKKLKSPKLLKAGPMEVVMLRPKNETSPINEKNLAVEAMKEKLQILLPKAESIEFNEARAVLLAARAVDDEHGVERNADLPNLDQFPTPRTQRRKDNEPDDDKADLNLLRNRLNDTREQLSAAVAALQITKKRVTEGERRRAFVSKVSDERVAGLRRELVAVATARKDDILRWRRRCFDAVLLSLDDSVKNRFSDLDEIFELLQSDEVCESGAAEWREWIIQQSLKQGVENNDDDEDDSVQDQSDASNNDVEHAQ
eukprot:CAMPEP_0168586176 /NCGR_PEP_ID=MMETSP0420-20121227/4131_1 /TAXON_ID=498008 /ORGANISM="Pessonella sp." /LENGTH=328 /DNA_ID=CAMNT_0008621223 /DNA_START=428 /DNA_END=1414 /DNA_ORIENTATION=-